MMTVLAAETNGGFFSPSIRRVKKDEIDIIYLKNQNSLKRLKKLNFEKAVIAPEAMEICENYAKKLSPCTDFTVDLLPRVLASMKELPVDEMFVCASPENAAKMIGVCSHCARLFTVVCREEADTGVFDSLYFNKGIVLRRIPTANSRVGKNALCITENGTCPRGVESVDVGKLGRVKFYGGRLSFLSELCLEPTAELYDFANIPLPEKGNISLNYGNEIFYLDRREIL